MGKISMDTMSDSRNAILSYIKSGNNHNNLHKANVKVFKMGNKVYEGNIEVIAKIDPNDCHVDLLDDVFYENGLFYTSYSFKYQKFSFDDDKLKIYGEGCYDKFKNNIEIEIVKE